jgi:hypothetical protein
MARLLALTDDARQALGGPEILLSRFPFRVGRECRIVPGYIASVERRLGMSEPNNDLYIVERSDLHNISREHFAIERNDDGRYFLTDRRSVLGTIVEGHVLGGNRIGGVCELHDHDVVILGNPTSSFIFKFRTS